MKKKIALLLGALFFTTCLTSCAQSNGGSGLAAGVLPDYDAKINELSISIGGWVVPNNLTDEQFVYMQESGIDTFYFAEAPSVYSINVNAITEQDKTVLAKMEEYGLSAILHVGSKSNEKLLNINNVAQYSAVKGICYDEPNKSQIDEIKTCLNFFNQNVGKKTLFTNLFPFSGSSFHYNNYKRLGFLNYEDYLRYYCNEILSNLTVGEKWLSADRYPLTFNAKGQPVLDDCWLENLEALAIVRKEYPNVKTNFFIQTMPYGGEERPAGTKGSRARTPSYEDVRLQEYTVMAFGYDRISCFCYGSPGVYSEFLEEQVAMIDREGNRTQIYYDVAKANQEIKAFDHVLKQFTWEGVFTNDGGKTNERKGISWKKLFSNLKNRMSIKNVNGLKKVFSTQDTLFGYFLDFNGNSGFMVVNCNDTSLNLTDEVVLTFEKSYGYTKALCYVGGEGKTVNIIDNTLTLNLGIGEGVFVIPY